MPAYTHITSGTTVGGVVSDITFTNWYHNIEIVNRSTGDMWARVDSVAPTVAGNDCFYIPPSSYLDVVNPQEPPEAALGTTPNTDVRIITAANAAYTISAGV